MFKVLNFIRREEAFKKAQLNVFEAALESIKNNNKKRTFHEVTSGRSVDLEDIPQFIDSLLYDEDIIVDTQPPVKPDEMQSGNKRPVNWREIAQHFGNSQNVQVTANAYPVVSFILPYLSFCLYVDFQVTEDGRGGYSRCKQGTIEMRLKRWKDDLDMERDTNTKTVVNTGGRKVPYGDDIDMRLFEQVCDFNHQINTIFKPNISHRSLNALLMENQSTVTRFVDFLLWSWREKVHLTK
jgi:hypothetical protein